MVRPREFDEAAVLSAALKCFWAHGFEATSVRDLIAQTGITGSSLYNAFGDKRALYEKALDRYVKDSVAARITRCNALPPRDAVQAFFADIIARSLGDTERKGCMLVNAALEVAPHDAGIRRAVAGVLTEIEIFFRSCAAAGQKDGSIARGQSPEDLGRHLLGVLMGMRVLARVRPERDLLEGMLRPAMALLDPPRH